MAGYPVELLCAERYPVADKTHPAWQRLCAQARTALATESVFVLPEFVRPEALQQMRQEAQALAPLAHHMDVVSPLYPDLTVGDERTLHAVRRQRFHTSVRALAYTRIPPHSPLRALYEWPPMLEFVAGLLGVPQLYRYDDPYGALNIAVMTEGDEFGWHFDQADFVVSLVLQAPQAGGEFLCRHAIRSEDDANDDGVLAVIENRATGVATVPMQEGSFMLFQGRYALHKVAPIRGPVPRLVALLAYDTRPGTVSSPGLLKARYGIEPDGSRG
ncbi:MAG: hypothetical protein AB7N91_02360 [Candidatus Tectimicrobiota bacterium]